MGEPQRPTKHLLRREQPVEAVDGTLFDRRIVLERRHHALGNRRFGGPVGAVEQDESIGPSFAHEVRQRSVDLFLDVLLADERPAGQRTAGAGLPRDVEELEAREFTPWVANDRFAVVIEDIAQIAAGVAGVAYRMLVEQAEEL